MLKHKIKKKLIKACIKQNASIFLISLLSQKVKVAYPNKWRFYSFFSYMLKCSKKESVGALRLEITKYEPEFKSNTKYYKFYDKMHIAPRLTLIVKEDISHISLDILPF